MTRRTWTTVGQTVAVVAVSVIVMSLPAADGTPWPDGDGPDTVSVSVVSWWPCPYDDMAVTSDGVCHDIDAWTDAAVDRIVTPVHPADGCMEDESWTAVDYRTPDGVDDVHGVTRACRTTETIGRHDTEDD